MSDWKMPDWMRAVVTLIGYTVNDWQNWEAAMNGGSIPTLAAVDSLKRAREMGLLIIPGTWTDDPPTEPGNIHVRYKDGHPKKNAIIAMVFESGGGLLLAYNTKIDLVSAWRSLGLERHTTPIQPPVEVKA